MLGPVGLWCKERFSSESVVSRLTVHRLYMGIKYILVGVHVKDIGGSYRNSGP